jgi:pimeloyl-ACP methyl ester carboxylesterase
MTRETLQFESGDARLFADRWPGTGPTLVLLHAGVADRRSWYTTADRLAGLGTLIAYDRRGFGETPPSKSEFRHVDDLLAVLDEVADGPTWLVGSSMGGGLALDAALTYPEKIAGLILLAPAISGAPEEGPLDPDTQRLSDLMDAADEAGDLDEVNRLEAWLWLQGPNSPEDRVGGAARELALEMNSVVLRNEVPEGAGASGLKAWDRLESIRLPVTVAWGDLDLTPLVARCEVLSARLPRGRRRVLTGTAHLPYLERPELVAGVIRDALLDAGEAR